MSFHIKLLNFIYYILSLYYTLFIIFIYIHYIYLLYFIIRLLFREALYVSHFSQLRYLKYFYHKRNMLVDIFFMTDTPAYVTGSNNRNFEKLSIRIHKSSLIQKVANGMQKRVHCAMHFEFLIAENREYPRETCNLPDRGSASFQKMLYQNRNIVVT